MKLELVALCLTVGSALALQIPQYRAQQPYQQYLQNQQFQNYQQRAAAAPILQYSNDVNPDGSFQYSYQTGDGISAQAAGFTRNLGIKDAEAQVVQGSYSYTGPDGVVYTVNYIADENGYRAQGAHLPTPPAVAAVPKALPYYNQQQATYQQQQAAYQRPLQQPYQYRPFQRRY
ncbi:Cuticle Protein CPR RR-1 16 [Frankliniella occidentalis]|uniref:Endocuticle structural glycoprotein CP-V n=1 Tax=Frankliniella occidentalis TaxID=133901 RepID=A0A482JL26_FRAOC|nr:endocuticle structural glycoprotein SgAbd-2-like [Frankliniella occidentalis]KAE8739216.1 Cuticle Protein CPR RR-1 16 [Frankliniella occidentalis]QBP34366.1 endocuticle structural glycoprotein CP-V [Frankliniella occidentalis]